VILTRSGAAWRDITVAMTEHSPAAQEVRTNTDANTLSVALLPVERALWRIDDGPTLTKRIPPATVSIRASREIVWARWEQTCKCIHIGIAPRLLTYVAREAGIGSEALEYCEGVDDPLVLQCALALAAEAATGGLAGEIYVQSIANVLAVHVLRKYAHSVVGHPNFSSALPDNKIKRARDYIEAHLASELSLDRIAETAALSTYHFARRFKAATGISPHRYVTQRRIEAAKILLLSTELPIHEIARQVGISNQSHFTTHFRSLVGSTPKAFRERS
jgi:AraC family transcriptional regulator